MAKPTDTYQQSTSNYTPDPMLTQTAGSTPIDPSQLALDPNNVYKVLPTLGQLPTVDVNAEQQAIGDLGRQVTGAINGYWNYQTPQMQAAQIAQSGVPSPTAQQFATSPQLQQLLSGMGYSPDILAQMQAGAQEAPAQAGAQQMAATRRSLGEAGLGTSPAAAAVTGDVARNVGDQQVAAQRAVSMANAQQAMQNMQFGVGQQTQIGLSNIEMANQMAMQNANRLFSAMQQNSQQQQQANQFNTQNQVQQQQNNAASKTNYATQLGTMWPSEREQYNLANLQNQTTQQMAPFQAATSLQQNALGYMGQQAPAAPTVQ